MKYALVVYVHCFIMKTDTQTIKQLQLLQAATQNYMYMKKKHSFKYIIYKVQYQWLPDEGPWQSTGQWIGVKTQGTEHQLRLSFVAL